jgi:chromosome segregation ATPase
MTAQVEVGGGDLTELEEAAAELRRLHAENERLTTLLADVGQVEAELAEKSDEVHRLHALVAACEPYLKEDETPVERIERECRDTEAVCRLYAKEREKNQELLEALKLALSAHGVMLLSDPPQEAWKAYGVEQKARAAIARAEGGKG